MKKNDLINLISLYTIFSLSLLYTVYGILHTPTVAAATVGLGVDTNTFDLEIQAGDSYKGDLAVFNTSPTVSLPVHIQLNLWDLKGDSEDIEFITSEPALNATKWFKLKTTDLIIEPDKSKEVNFTIKVPSDVSPGTYLVMMRLQAVLPEHYFEAEGPRLIPELGVIFFIKIPLLTLEGTRTSYGAEVLSVSPKDTRHIGLLEKTFINRAKAGVFEDAVKTLVAKVRNTGIYHFKSSGFVEIKNLFGRTVSKIELKERYLLPNKSRDLEIQVFPPPSEKSASLTSNIINSIAYQLKKNSYLGTYSAVLTLSIPNEPPVVSTINFWVIPWKFWLPTLAIFSLILYILLKLRHRLGDFLRTIIKGKPH